MKLKKALKILKRHNKWRRSEKIPNIPMENPTQLGIAIDTILEKLKPKNSKP